MPSLHVVMMTHLVLPAHVSAQTPSAPQTSIARTIDVTGMVIDSRTERPLAGVRVAAESPSVGVDTDADGRFALALPAGKHVLVVSLIGYAVARHAVDVGEVSNAPLTIRLSEGAGAYEEQVTVSGDTPSDSALAPSAAALHSGDLQALRGVTLDDPLRAVHALPSVTATDDFYSEFAVRGSAFRHVGLVVDGVPSEYLMHAVHGVTDGGSIAMINTDALGNIVLMPGSYPQRFGRHLTGEVDLTMREGDREAFRARAGLSGTSATALAEGPLAGGRGSWLVSARRSYLDLLLERIDDEGNFGFGFADAQAKVVLDLGTRHQLQMLALGGASAFDEEPDDLGLNDPADSKGRSWLTSLAWRFTPSPRVALTQRIYATGLAYKNRNREQSVLDDSLSTDIGWRADAVLSAARGVVLEVGADAQQLRARYSRQRSVNDAPTLTPITSYTQSGVSSSGYVQAVLGSRGRLVVAPGVRVDYWVSLGRPRRHPGLLPRSQLPRPRASVLEPASTDSFPPSIRSTVSEAVVTRSCRRPHGTSMQALRRSCDTMCRCRSHCSARRARLVVDARRGTAALVRRFDSDSGEPTRRGPTPFLARRAVSSSSSVAMRQMDSPAGRGMRTDATASRTSRPEKYSGPTTDQRHTLSLSATIACRTGPVWARSTVSARTTRWSATSARNQPRPAHRHSSAVNSHCSSHWSSRAMIFGCLLIHGSMSAWIARSRSLTGASHSSSKWRTSSIAAIFAACPMVSVQPVKSSDRQIPLCPSSRLPGSSSNSDSGTAPPPDGRHSQRPGCLVRSTTIL